MRNDPSVVSKQTGKIVLAIVPAVGNATIKVSAKPFPQTDTTYYQIGKHGDYVQEQGG